MAKPDISNWDDRYFVIYCLGVDKYILNYTYSWLMAPYIMYFFTRKTTSYYYRIMTL